MNNSKLGKLMLTVGLVGGAFYGYKSGKKPTTIALLAAGGAIAGLLIGNAVTNFYE
jgi:hypothetical protein